MAVYATQRPTDFSHIKRAFACNLQSAASLQASDAAAGQDQLAWAQGAIDDGSLCTDQLVEELLPNRDEPGRMPAVKVVDVAADKVAWAAGTPVAQVMNLVGVRCLLHTCKPAAAAAAAAAAESCVVMGKQASLSLLTAAAEVSGILAGVLTRVHCRWPSGSALGPPGSGTTPGR